MKIKNYLFKVSVVVPLIIFSSTPSAFVFTYDNAGVILRYELEIIQGTLTNLRNQLNLQPWIQAIDVGTPSDTALQEAQMNFAGALLEKASLQTDLPKNTSGPEPDGWLPFVYVRSYPRLELKKHAVIGRNINGAYGPAYLGDDNSINGSSITSFSVDDIHYWFVGELLLGPSSVDILASFQPNAFSLRNTFNLQSAKISQGLSYDCTVFDANNMCISFAGTRSNGDNGFDATTGALIIAHRPTANIRFGAYVDQTIGTTDSLGLKVKRGSPGYGLFGVWSQRTDGLGTQVRVAANAGKVDVETTRLAIETAEAGFGQSNIKSNGVQLEASQGYALNNQWTTRPYVGFRQMTNKRDAYAESSIVDFPLAYAGVKQTTDSILAGVRFIGKLTPKTSLTLSAGMERDVKSSVDDYKATETDIGDISLSMTENQKKSRPTASLGVVHSIDKTQTIGLSVVHRKEALQSGNTTTGMLQYSVGF
jgi:hypothetical protein